MSPGPFGTALRRALLFAIAAVGLTSALAQSQPPAPRDAEKPRHPAEPRATAPSYVAPPGAYIFGPEAGSQLYFYSVPYPPYGIPAPPPHPVARDTPSKTAPPPEAAQPPVGHIVFVVNPVSAEVSLDGLRLTQRPDLSYAVGVLEGRHVVRVTAGGFEPHERALDVQRGIGMFVTVRLNPAVVEKKSQ